MKYNPITKDVYTDDGVFLKQLHCPLVKKWHQMQPASSAQAKLCSACNKAVYDTAKLSDSEVQAMLNDAPETCLKIDPEQTNVTITYAKYR